MSTSSDSLPRVFVVGDSISMHYGPYLERFGAGVFRYARKSGEEGFLDLDRPSGANGGDSSMVVDYLERATAGSGLPADYSLVNCGLHDIKTDPESGRRQVEPDEYEANLERIATLFAAGGAPVLVWIRTTPVVDEVHNARVGDFRRHESDVERYNAIADRVMGDRGVPTIDLHGFTTNLGDPTSRYVDHVHFTDRVRELQAAYIAGFLARRGR